MSPSDRAQESQTPARPEFDAYARNYVGGAENPVKRLLGGGLEPFLAVKADWLLDDLRRRPLPLPDPRQARLLDFGCGTGEMLQLIRARGWAGVLEGCDVSAAMLSELQTRWTSGPQPRLHLADFPDLALPTAAYDVIVACCVFHHIEASARLKVLSNLASSLRPGGRLVLFEHNPRNPLTRWVVARTPIDEHAVLLDSMEAFRCFSVIGLRCIRLRYLLFLPPRMRGVRGWERVLARLPFGGQYVLTGESPEPAH